MGTLEITFYGPFVYVLNTNPIRVVAPKCLGHKAGIFTINDEKRLRGLRRQGMKRVYELTGLASSKKMDYFNEDWILDASKGCHVTGNLDSAFFCLHLPRPKMVAGINKVDVTVIRKGQPGSYQNPQATGIRFIYDCDLKKSNIELTLPDGSVYWKPNLSSPYDHADIVVRYAAPGTADIDHEDAEECFEHIAGLLGLDWWLDFGDFDKSEMAVRPGNDCHAPILAVRS